MQKSQSKLFSIIRNSPRNHSDVSRPHNAQPKFYAYWADVNADECSESHLYFSNRDGDKVWHLPCNLTEDFAAPHLVEP